MRVYGSADLVWDGHTLRLGSKRGRTLAAVVPDIEWPGMYRVRRHSTLSDMVNLTRAKDAARCLAPADLNAQETRAVAPYVRYFAPGVSAAMAST
jgi:hypothetical protein